MRSVTAGALLFSFLYAATAVHAAPPSDAAAPAAAKPAAKPAAKTAPAAKPATATPSAAAASAAPCHTSGTYDAWLAAFEREALTQRFPSAPYRRPPPHHLRPEDRLYRPRPAVFTQTFLDFSGRMAAAYRIQRGQALIKTNAATFARIEQEFGVPRRSSSRSGVWKATSVPIWASILRSVR
jgi:membrane-bound lytic murein transglycosylase B